MKEALLFAVGNLSESIRVHSDLKRNIEPMLKNHVMTDLSSPHPLLKSRACWVYGEFSEYTFEDNDHIQQAVHGIYQSLFTDVLPIKFAAALALAKMLNNDTAIACLKPVLANILEVYLKIMNEIDSEELIGALEVIMEKYQEEIGPFAVQLSQQLATKYHALVTEDAGDDYAEMEERELAAAGCVTAIRRILEALNKDRAGLAQVLPIILPIMMHSLTPDGLEAIEEGLDCINIFIYYGCTPETKVPECLWKILPMMMYVVVGGENDMDGGYGFEYLQQVAICLQNFIAKDPATLMTVMEGQTETFFELIVKFIQRILVINSSSAQKMDGITILRVLITIFESMPGQIEAALPTLVGMLLAEIKMAFENKTNQNY